MWRYLVSGAVDGASFLADGIELCSLTNRSVRSCLPISGVPSVSG